MKNSQKGGALVLILVLVALVGIGIYFMYFHRVEKVIMGKVVSCSTGLAITDVTIQADAGYVSSADLVLGEGHNKEYLTTTTDKDGNFKLSWQVSGSPLSIYSKKDGYITAYQIEYPATGVVIKMLEASTSTDYVTYNCKPRDDCFGKGGTLDTIRQRCNK